MANNIPNRQVICEVLLAYGAQHPDLVVLCSDSRGSASLSDFAQALPKQFVEMGIAEQSLVSTAAGLAVCGKKAYAASPACFLSTRSFEQIKVDVAYANTNVKLIGISGGISYGALGMTHHSAQDIAALAAVPNMRVYLPSDRHQTKKLMEALLADDKPAYIRVGRNAVADVYDEGMPFTLNKGCEIFDGDDAAIIACGELVAPAKEAAVLLRKEGIAASVLDMYCVKPIDEIGVQKAASRAKVVVTVEEHSLYGGLGAMVSQIVSAHCPKRVKNLALPDTPVISGTSEAVFAHYGLTAQGIANTVKELLCHE